MLLAQLPAERARCLVAATAGCGYDRCHQRRVALPHSDVHADIFAKAAMKVREQGGQATTFTAEAFGKDEADALIAQSRTERAKEYDEFAERTDGMLAEIDKETRKQKNSFAEFEEIEQNLEKLPNGWARSNGGISSPTNGL